jgi:hypothetical protein
MKNVFLFLVLLVCAGALTQAGMEKTTFIITKTTPYCGGANPSEEILEEAQQKKIPYGEKFYIIKGSCNVAGRKIVDSLMMDASGKGFSMLKPGCYSIINDFGHNKIDVDTSLYDMDCLEKLWKTPLFKFEVIKGKSESFSFNIDEPCPYNKPCLKVILPYPM